MASRAQPVPPNAQNPGAFHNFNDYSQQVFDRLPGVIVPQQVFPAPQGQANFQQLQSIPFLHNGVPSVRLRDALESHTLSGLDAVHSAPTLSLTGTRVTLRILWPGYPAWRYENGINVFDHTQRANPRTLGHIAHQVARLIHAFYQEMAHTRGQEGGWLIQRMSFDDLYLVELRHVSKGSWQPVLCWRTG